jgi:c-di-GMP-binding flagellar brake protein YcgR
MGLAHFRRIDRRRMVRVTLCVPLTVHQETETQQKFLFRARTLSVNGYGALLQFDGLVSLGDRLRLRHEISGQSIAGRVSSVRCERDEKTYAGVEFESPSAKFWNMTFPRPGERPLRRVIALGKC